MPVGATLGAAVIGAGAGIYTSSQASKAQSKAAGQAADLSLEVAQTNNAFAQSIYDQNEGHLTPFIDMGGAAGDELMGLLLGPAPASTGSNSSPNGWYNPPPTNSGSGGVGGQSPGANSPPYTQAQIDAAWHDGIDGNAEQMQGANNAWYAAHPQTPATTPPAATPPPPPPPPPAPAATAMSTAAAPMAAPVATPTNAVAAVAPPPATPQPNALAGTYGAGTHAAGGPDGLTNDLALSGYGPGTIQSTNAGAHGMDALPGGGATVPGGGVIAPPGGPVPPPTTAPPGATPPPATTSGGTTQPNTLSAWDTYKNSSEYQNRLNAGLDATATKYAAAGAFESGAEKKAIVDYAETFASNELANYMDNLYRVMALGASSASSLAGVGTNLVNQVASNNNNAASAAGNAALVQGQSSANNWNAVGNAVGQIAGGAGGAIASSYPQQEPVPTYLIPSGMEGAYAF